jgi:hypothetical protein
MIKAMTGALAAAGLASGADAASGPQAFWPSTAGRETLDHGGWTRLLARHVSRGADGVDRVDYRAWQASAADRSALAGYLSMLQAKDPRRLTRNGQMAYWANLYNAETIRLVLAAWPVGSIQDIRPNPLAIGPWKTPTLSVMGTILSLDQIEHRILRAGFKDPRVHYALNCASVSCPDLRRQAWTADSLETDLDVAARAYVNHPRGARMVRGKLVVSSIYVWFKADFGGDDAGVIAHLSRYAEPALKTQLATVSSIGGNAYDWRLNQTGGKR